MRFSAATLVAALPALAAAQENPLDQYVAQFQQILGQVSSKLRFPAHMMLLALTRPRRVL